MTAETAEVKVGQLKWDSKYYVSQDNIDSRLLNRIDKIENKIKLINKIIKKNKWKGKL